MSTTGSPVPSIRKVNFPPLGVEELRLSRRDRICGPYQPQGQSRSCHENLSVRSQTIALPPSLRLRVHWTLGVAIPFTVRQREFRLTTSDNQAPRTQPA